MGSISSSFIARVTGVGVEYENFNLGKALSLPQRIAIVGQGNTLSTYATTPLLVTSAAQVGAAYGYGSPVHLAALQLFPANNDGVKGIPVTVYPLEDDPAGVVADGAIECVGTATETVSFQIEIGGVSTGNITFTTGDVAATALGSIKTAINAVAEMPVIAGTVAAGSLPLTAKWKGESGNDIDINIDDLDVAGLTFSSVAFASGAANPDVRDATDQMNVWETFILNCMNYDDDTTLGYFDTFNEGRWLADVKKPCLVATGTVGDFSERTTISDARKSDRTNFFVASVSSRELPFVIAARGLAKDIVPTANDHPAMNYGSVAMTGLDAGDDIDQEDGNTRDAAVKLGSSTNIKVGSVAQIQDMVTFYHPVAEGLYPAYRYVVDVVKLMNIVYNVDIVQEAFRGRPILPDADPIPIDESLAIQPKNILTTLKNLATSLSRKAIISDLAFTLSNIEVAFDSNNPKRVNTTFPVKLSGNVEVNDTTVKFGFYLPN